MLIDKRTEFADAEAVTNGTKIYSGIIDLGVARDLGAGCRPYLVVTVDEDISVGGGGYNVKFDLITDDNSGLSSPTVLLSSQSFPMTSPATGKAKAGSVLWAVPLPIEGAAYERYLALQSVANLAPATGKISAFLTTDVAAWKAYADAVN